MNRKPQILSKVETKEVYPTSGQDYTQKETSPLIYGLNQLIGFYISVTLE